MTPRADALVTVIVPVYNVEAYLDRCVSSLVAQTYRHLDILLIDDGSSDGSAAMCDAWAERDARVRVIHLAHRGVSGARNAGLEGMRGAYFTFVDSDDWVDASYVETLRGLVGRYAAQVAAVGFLRTDAASPPVRPDLRSVERRLSPEELAEEFFGAQHTLWTMAGAKLFDARLWDGLRFPEGRVHEDEFLTHQALVRATVAAATTAPLYYYFQHAASLTGRVHTVEQRLDAVDALRAQVAGLRADDRTDPRHLRWATGQLFRKHIYLHRQLHGAGRKPDAASVRTLRASAQELWQVAPWQPFSLFAQAYARAPRLVDALHQGVTRVRTGGRGFRPGSAGAAVGASDTGAAGARAPRRLRVLVSSGWLGGAGGAERALYSYLHALASDDVDLVVRTRLPGPFAAIPPGIRVADYAGWRWWAAGHHAGYQGWVIQRILNPLRRVATRPYDIHLRALSGPGLESAARARVSLVIPSGDHLTPEVAHRYTYVAMQAPDNARLAAGAPTTLLPPPVLPLPAPEQPRQEIPPEFLLTVFNPYGAMKGAADLDTLLTASPLPLVWCHSTRTVDFEIPTHLQDHPKLVHIDDPSQGELRYLYENCRAYVSLSRSEGFGWSIADGLRYSPLVVAREVGVLSYPEVRDLPVVLITDFAAVDWAAALERATPGPRELPWLTPQAFRERLLSLLKEG